MEAPHPGPAPAYGALPDTDAGLDRYYGDPPHGVRANMVMTADGAGAFRGRTKAITDPADQQLLKHLRGLADAVLVGGATVQAEKYGPVRLDPDRQAQRTASGYAALPPLVVVSARAALSPELRLFRLADPDARPIIVTTDHGAAHAGALREVADVVAGGEVFDPAWMLAMLAERGLTRVLCEGGPFLLGQLVEHGLVDDMCLTLSPYLAGSQPTTPQPSSTLEVPSRLALRHVLVRDDLLYLRYARP